MADKKVASIEDKEGGRGTYWKVTWNDGKTDNVFNKEWLPLLEQSRDVGLKLSFTKEKNEKGYYNIVSLGAALETGVSPDAKTPPKSEAVKPAAAAVKTTASAESKYKADPAKTESIEKQAILKAAIELNVARIQQGQKVSADMVVTDAIVLSSFFNPETKEVTREKTNPEPDRQAPVEDNAKGQPEVTGDMFVKVLKDAGWSQLQTANHIEFNYQIPKQRNVPKMFEQLNIEQKQEFLRYVEANPEEVPF